MSPTLHPKVLASCVALATDILIGTKKDFSKFTCRPVESEKDLSRPFKLNRILASAGRMSKVSSAYWTMGKSPPKLSLSGCFKMPIFQATLIIVWSKSAAKTNKRWPKYCAK